MPKKKAAKKASRKAAPRKKSAAKKSIGKSRHTARKPVRKPATKSAKKITRPKTAKKAAKKESTLSAPAPPRVEVWPYSDDPPSCDLQPHGKVPARPKSEGGQVNFYNHGTSQCTIHFDNVKVFGTLTAFLGLRDNYLDVACDPGANEHERTNVTIEGCNMDKSLRILNGPTDIIVP